MNALACVGAARCYIAGAFPYETISHLGPFVTPGTTPMGVLAAVEAGGDGWSLVQADRAVVGLTGLSCGPSSSVTSTCVAIASSSANTPAVVRLSLSGSVAPTQTTPPSGVTVISGVACAGRRCFLTATANSAAALLRLDGDRWSTVDLPAGVQSVAGIACPTADVCLVIGVYAGGRPALLTGSVSVAGLFRWRAALLPAATRSLTAIACPTASACWLGAQVAVPTKPGAATATKTMVLRTLDLTPLQPILPTGETTTTATIPTRPTTHGNVHRAPPPTWSTWPLPAGVATVSALVCPTTAVCYGVATLSSGVQALLGAGVVGAAFTGEIAPPTSA